MHSQRKRTQLRDLRMQDHLWLPLLIFSPTPSPSPPKSGFESLLPHEKQGWQGMRMAAEPPSACTAPLGLNRDGAQGIKGSMWPCVLSASGNGGLLRLRRPIKGAEAKYWHKTNLHSIHALPPPPSSYIMLTVLIRINVGLKEL